MENLFNNYLIVASQSINPMTKRNRCVCVRVSVCMCVACVCDENFPLVPTRWTWIMWLNELMSHGLGCTLQHLVGMCVSVPAVTHLEELSNSIWALTTGQHGKLRFAGWRCTFPVRCSSMIYSFLFPSLSLCLSPSLSSLSLSVL